MIVNLYFSLPIVNFTINFWRHYGGEYFDTARSDVERTEGP